MVFCGYNNIHDFCTNGPYKYYYSKVKSISGNLIPDKDYYAPVLRENIFTGETTNVSSSTNSSLIPCSQYDTGDILSDWDCYQIWKETNTTLDPPDYIFQQYQQSESENIYNKTISAGYTLTINSNTIQLPRDTNSQNNILNSLVQSIISETDPIIQDINGNLITVPRQVLQDQIQDYISSNQQLDYSINQANNSTNNLTNQISSISSNISLISTSGCGPGYLSDGSGGCIEDSAMV